ncbi:17544_t:CDS:1 [Acaulospora colombiana]|uniref:17544_t:CDS:1 n=1 Tax=Acaulospora colombiana TaxID=27376 RepID=A0ACA9K0E0_9GLOM|nr:17544_t:CDS:1 [Acaulospora colombiana]
MSYFTFEVKGEQQLANYSPRELYSNASSNIDATLAINRIISSCFSEEALCEIKKVTMIPLTKLVTPFENTRTQKIPRPQNSFVIYRRNVQVQLAAEGNKMSNRKLDTVSKIAGKRWQEEPNEVKELFGLISECAKKVHNFLYPDYVYHPRRSATTSTPMIFSSFHGVPMIRWKNVSSKHNYPRIPYSSSSSVIPTNSTEFFSTPLDDQLESFLSMSLNTTNQ